MENKELIICIVNPGYSDLVMNAAKEQGAGGGTILNAKGTGRKGIEKVLDMPVQQDKELVLIVTERSKRDAILKALNDNCGLDTAGHGIAFSVPVSDAMGFHINRENNG